MKEIGFLAIGLGMFMLIYFTATKDTKIPAVETVNLPEIKIGSQIWSPANLGISTFRNGDMIPEANDAA